MDGAGIEGRAAGERHTCVGIGWVNFDVRSSRVGTTKSESELAAKVPEVRCFGLRDSQPVPQNGQTSETSVSQVYATDSSGPGRPVHAAAAIHAAHPATTGSTSATDVQTSMLVCAGQLSMILPPALIAGAAAAAARGPQPESQWAQCQPHCEGVSFRVDKVTVDSSSASTVPPPQQQQEEEDGRLASFNLQALSQKEPLRVVYGALASVVGRAGAIVASLQGAHVQGGVGRFPAETAGAMQKICTQANKIAWRSVEHLGQVATFPWKLVRGTWSSGADESNDTRGSGK